MAEESGERSYDLPLTVGADHVHPHSQHTGRRWLDLSIALSAIAISVISLFVAIQHGRTEEKLVAANSWPFVLYTTAYDHFGTPDARIDLKIENQGVGPARVQWLTMKVGGRPVPSWRYLIRMIGVNAGDLRGLVSAGLVSQDSPVGILPARGNVVLLGWQAKPGNEASLDAIDRLRNRLEMRACYCSVLDECWVSDLKPVSTPTRVKVCTAPPDAYQ